VGDEKRRARRVPHIVLRTGAFLPRMWYNMDMTDVVRKYPTGPTLMTDREISERRHVLLDVLGQLHLRLARGIGDPGIDVAQVRSIVRALDALRDEEIRRKEEE